MKQKILRLQPLFIHYRWEQIIASFDTNLILQICMKSYESYLGARNLKLTEKYKLKPKLQQLEEKMLVVT